MNAEQSAVTEKLARRFQVIVFQREGSKEKMLVFTKDPKFQLADGEKELSRLPVFPPQKKIPKSSLEFWAMRLRRFTPNPNDQRRLVEMPVKSLLPHGKTVLDHFLSTMIWTGGFSKQN